MSAPTWVGEWWLFHRAAYSHFAEDWCRMCHAPVPSHDADCPVPKVNALVVQLGEALTRSDSLLSLLRHRAGITSWGEIGMCEQGDVDEVIGQARQALAAYHRGPQ